MLLYVPMVSAMDEDPTEGRIAEHSVFSLVAVAGLIIIAHFTRKKRKLNQDLA